MEFREVVRRRRMVRHYDGRPVDPAALERVLDAARRGPSAGNVQGQRLVVVTDTALRRGVAACCDEEGHVARGRPAWLSSAPVHIVPCVSPPAYRDRYAEPDKAAPGRPDAWDVPFWWVDGGATLMLVLLAAVDEGLAAGFLDIADREGVCDLLGIPSDVEPLGVVTLGYPGPRDAVVGSARRGRRPASEVVHRERWGSPGSPGAEPG